MTRLPLLGLALTLLLTSPLYAGMSAEEFMKADFVNSLPGAMATGTATVTGGDEIAKFQSRLNVKLNGATCRIDRVADVGGGNFRFTVSVQGGRFDAFTSDWVLPVAFQTQGDGYTATVTIAAPLYVPSMGMVSGAVTFTRTGVFEGGTPSNTVPITGNWSANFHTGTMSGQLDLDENYMVGGQGQNSAFWQQPTNEQYWTGWHTDDAFDTVFEVTTGSTATLLETLQSPNADPIDQLMREATAALLNAANPSINYLYTQAEVKQKVQDAIDSGNAANHTALANDFNTQNSKGWTP